MQSTEFEYEPWRHGGWYVTNVHHLSGAVGCVSRHTGNPKTGKPDGKWRIVCDSREGDFTYSTRDEAARAERELITEEKLAARDSTLELIASGVPTGDSWRSASSFMEFVAEVLDQGNVPRPEHYGN